MKRAFHFASIALLLAACESPSTSDAGSSGGMDGAVRDGGVPAGDGGTDAGMVMNDAGMMMSGCGAGMHMCGDDCVADMANEVANGCRLGCGVPCPLPGAICGDDGYCGRPDCTPMTCEDLDAECGLIDDGCGARRNCGGCSGVPGATCEDNGCVCATEDPREPNDTRDAATTLGTLTDIPDSSTSVTNAYLTGPTDEDWYTALVENNSGDGDPIVTVTVDGLPAGDNYLLEVFHTCPDGSFPICSSGSSVVGPSGIRGCASAMSPGSKTISYDANCDLGAFDSRGGSLFARVFAAEDGINSGGCMGTYNLTIEVE